MKMAALAGGVGGARLASGLAEILPAGNLTLIVNTGDDFEWMGLRVCPDIDTIIYTLASLANPVTGWGVRDDTFRTLQRLGALGCETWFRVGDLDMATHIVRTQLLRQGKSLTEVTKTLCTANGVRVPVLPMTDQPVPTLIHTEEGTIEFQDYFVRRKCSPRVCGVSNSDIGDASPAPGVLEAIASADAVVVCPSNPLISIGPILSVPGIRAALETKETKILAVSPIIRGEAVKGPTAKMMRETGMEVSAAGVARLYRQFVDIFVADESDKELQADIEALGMKVRFAPILMNDATARHNLARAILEIVA